MRRCACVAAAVLAGAFAFGPVVAAETAVDSARVTIGGRYLANGDAAKTIVITPLVNSAYRLVSADWEGVGFLDGTGYWGVFRHHPKASPPELAGAGGTHQATLRPDGALVVRGEYTRGRSATFDVVWTPERKVALPGRPGRPAQRPENPDSPPAISPEKERPPELGEYVYVEELPEAVTKVAPSYPEAARTAKVQGTVMVQALVGKDGRVKDTKIVSSIPGLDEAAGEAVRQWVFKPAMTEGKPVAVWVAVPVRFALH